MNECSNNDRNNSEYLRQIWELTKEDCRAVKASIVGFTRLPWSKRRKKPAQTPPRFRH